MSISRKPKEQSSKTSEAAIQAVIGKGGSVAKLKSETQKKTYNFALNRSLSTRSMTSGKDDQCLLHAIPGYWKPFTKRYKKKRYNNVKVTP